MKKIIAGSFMFLLVSFVVSCENKNQNKDYKNLNSENELKLTNAPEGRQLIHNATINANVTNCLEATSIIEQKVLTQNGFILHDEVSKKVNKQITSTISTDSLKRLTYYTVTSNMVVKVPDSSLHQLLRNVQLLAKDIQLRVLDASDVTFDIALNDLNLKDITKKNALVDSMGNFINTNELVINQRKIKDAVQYATVSINLQEPEQLEQETIINTTATWAKDTSIGNKAWFSLQKGFYQLLSVLIYIIQFWWVAPLFILSKVLWISLKKYATKWNLNKL